MNFLNMLTQKFKLPEPGLAIAGRSEALATADNHAVNGRSLKGPYPENMEFVVVGLGCFWGAERLFWEKEGVWVTAVGYAGGTTQNPTYQEVCSGRTGHTEAVLVVFDPAIVSFESLMKTFLEAHDPTQGMRQGNDIGTQYRSAVYCSSKEQLEAAKQILADYEQALKSVGHCAITTEVAMDQPFYFAEESHQQYLEKNPGGYCGLAGTGVTCAVGNPSE
ncbi:MAG: peptide-methionine (S)-S-oxide reductase MsrA [Stappiaceae bacterium]